MKNQALFNTFDHALYSCREYFFNSKTNPASLFDDVEVSMSQNFLYNTWLGHGEHNE